MSTMISDELRARIDAALAEEPRITVDSRIERCGELSSLLFGTAAYAEAVEGAFEIVSDR